MKQRQDHKRYLTPGRKNVYIHLTYLQAAGVFEIERNGDGHPAVASAVVEAEEGVGHSYRRSRFSRITNTLSGFYLENTAHARRNLRSTRSFSPPRPRSKRKWTSQGDTG